VYLYLVGAQWLPVMRDAWFTWLCVPPGSRGLAPQQSAVHLSRGAQRLSAESSDPVQRQAQHSVWLLSHLTLLLGAEVAWLSNRLLMRENGVNVA
jgi:hypothetical protein